MTLTIENLKIKLNNCIKKEKEAIENYEYTGAIKTLNTFIIVKESKANLCQEILNYINQKQEQNND